MGGKVPESFVNREEWNKLDASGLKDSKDMAMLERLKDKRLPEVATTKNPPGVPQGPFNVDMPYMKHPENHEQEYRPSTSSFSFPPDAGNGFPAFPSFDSNKLAEGSSYEPPPGTRPYFYLKLLHDHTTAEP